MQTLVVTDSSLIGLKKKLRLTVILIFLICFLCLRCMLVRHLMLELHLKLGMVTSVWSQPCFYCEIQASLGYRQSHSQNKKGSWFLLKPVTNQNMNTDETWIPEVSFSFYKGGKTGSERALHATPEKTGKQLTNISSHATSACIPQSASSPKVGPFCHGACSSELWATATSASFGACKLRTWMNWVIPTELH